jgi:hypothetical protein
LVPLIVSQVLGLGIGFVLGIGSVVSELVNIFLALCFDSGGDFLQLLVKEDLRVLHQFLNPFGVWVGGVVFDLLVSLGIPRHIPIALTSR